MSLTIGSIFDTRYKILARIGHGGMAEVYEATDIINKKTVAIKLIREDIMRDPINLRRFENEATIAASMDHPNVVAVYNHGRYLGRPYIINEYIKGQTLKDIIDYRGSISLTECVSSILQVSDALVYAHSHGIIHRDIKPDNIFILSDGTAKLGDFGIAIADGLDTGLTKNNEDIIGSVHYLAPEIIQGKNASEQSDIYALGVTFFEALTGHAPFEKDNAVNIAVAQIREKFPSIKTYLPKCPKEIEKIVYKATKKRRSDRYASMKEFHDELLVVAENPDLLKESKSLLARLFGFK